MSAWGRLSSAVRRRPFLAAGFGLAALVVLSLLAAYGALQTQAGRNALARYIERTASIPGVRTIEIGRIDGVLPQRIRIDRVAVADRDGVWLSIEEISLDWHPLMLLRGTLSVEELTAERTVLSRLPAAAGSGAEGGGPLVPPVDVSVNLVAFRSLTLERPVLGEAATMSIEANGAFADGVVEAALSAQRTDGTPGSADLWLSYDAASRVLDLETTVAEPQGGLIARLAGLPGAPALDLTVKGEGPPGAWEGTLEAGAESLLTVESRISVALGDEVKVGLEGFATPGPALPDAARTALQPSTSFAMDIVKPSDVDRLDVSVRRFESGLFRASGSAGFVLEDATVSGSATLDVADAAPLSPFLAPVAFSGGRVEISFSGAITGPAMEVRGQLSDFAIDPVRAKDATFDLRLEPDRPFGDPSQSLSVSGRIDTAGFASGVESLDPLLGSSPAAELDLRIRPTIERIEVASLQIRGEGGSATAKGTVDLATWRIDAEGDLDLPDMAVASSLAGLPLGGRGHTGYTVSWAEGAELDLRFSGAVAEPRVGNATAEALLGPNATLAGRLNLKPDGALSMSDLSVSGRAIEASGGFSMPPEGDTLTADYAARITDLAPLGLADAAGRAGLLETSGKAEGKPGDPAVRGTASIQSTALGGIAFDRLSLTYSVRSVVIRPNGDVKVQGAGPLLPDLSGSFGFAWEGDLIHVDNIAAKARETGVTGNVVLSLSGAPATGRLHLSSSDLGHWSDLAGLDLSGGAEAGIILADERGRQAIHADGTGRGAGFGPSVVARSVEFHAELHDPVNGGTVKASATMREASLPGATLSSATLTFDGTLRDAALSLKAEGELRGKLTVDAEARMVRDQERIRITLSRLEGEAGGAPLKLRQPATLTLGPETELKDLALDIGGGQLAADFRLTADRVVLNAHATAMPLGVVAPALPPRFAAAKADGDVALEGPPSRPDGSISLSVSGLAPGEIHIAPEGLTLQLDGTFRNGVLAATGRAVGLESVATDLDISVPLKISLSPVEIGLAYDRPAKGVFSYAGPVEPAWALTGLDRHRLSGEADISLRFSGTLEDPLINGKVALAKGRYENLDTGTILTDLEFLARPSASAIVIEQATAHDGAEGQLSASGRLDFGAADHMAIDLAAHFTEARLVRRDELVASVSGDLTLTGSTVDRLLSGRLEVNEAEIRLVGGLPPNVVDLDVVEKGATADAEKPRPAPTPSHTRLDLQIDMPKRVFVRGRGLDSEWGGRLLISGTTDTVRVEGELRPLRGRYDFAGKTFTLQQGSIGFTGAREINPLLDLSAARKAGDLTAIIRVTGTARRPQIRMESIPALPQDEILSRILFNKSTGRLTATEALRLSQAVATLSGTGGGGGFMDFARGLLNLDVLRFGGDGGGDDTAQAGKYLTDKVFVGVEAGGSAGSSGATVEVEVTPNLKLEGDVSGGEKSEIGIKWKRDY